MVNKDKVMEAIGIAGATLAVACMVALGFFWYNEKRGEKPKVLTQEQVKQPETVAKGIHVTQPAAQTIVREIERSSGETPQVTYYIQSPSVEKAAETTAKQIEKQDKSLLAKALDKADRTIVTPNDKLQKVDVYKISLRKAHKIKGGVTYVDEHSYFTAGYQAGRWEGLMHFDWQGKPKGGSVLYTVHEW